MQTFKNWFESKLPLDIDARQARYKARRKNAELAAVEVGNAKSVEELESFGREALLTYLAYSGLNVGAGSRFALLPTHKIRSDIAETLGLI